MVEREGGRRFITPTPVPWFALVPPEIAAVPTKPRGIRGLSMFTCNLCNTQISGIIMHNPKTDFTICNDCVNAVSELIAAIISRGNNV
jgi:hypothetical protein